jgi:two-component system, NtrC family, response regulator
VPTHLSATSAITNSSYRRAESAHAASPTPLRFRSATYLRSLEQAERFARDRQAPILIEGETGTGKTVIARHVHQRSPRCTGPYQYVVLSTLDDSLANSELFGHVPGAYTDARTSRAGHFASAHNGTLFLDEIGKASCAVQRKLLHAIEYGEIRPLGADRDMRVDTRIIAASNNPLSDCVARNEFLPDLYARLGTFRIRLPALRERRADIPLLVDYYLSQHAPSCGYDAALPQVDRELMDALTNAEWPYNLRQLHATVHRLVLEAQGDLVITLEHCRDDLAYLTGGESRLATLTLDDLQAAIAKAGNNMSRAAKSLGMDRTTLYRKLNVLRGEKAPIHG